MNEDARRSGKVIFRRAAWVVLVLAGLLVAYVGPYLLFTDFVPLHYWDSDGNHRTGLRVVDHAWQATLWAPLLPIELRLRRLDDDGLDFFVAPKVTVGK